MKVDQINKVYELCTVHPHSASFNIAEINSIGYDHKSNFSIVGESINKLIDKLYETKFDIIIKYILDFYIVSYEKIDIKNEKLITSDKLEDLIKLYHCNYTPKLDNYYCRNLYTVPKIELNKEEVEKLIINHEKYKDLEVNRQLLRDQELKEFESRNDIIKENELIMLKSLYEKYKDEIDLAK